MKRTLVLVAEDDPFNLRLLQEVCEAAGYRVATAADGRQVLDTIARERPDILLLDVELPVLDGFEVIRVLKSDPELCAIPVVVVTSSEDVEAKSKSIELGAEDYVTKPYRVFEVQQRLRNVLRLKAAQDAAVEVQESAFVDPLTLAGTAQQLQISVNYEFTRALRYGHPISLFAIRLCNYQELREMGQDLADHAMLQMVRGFRNCIRNIDHLFRNQSHELVAILPQTDEPGALVVRRRIEEAVETGAFWLVQIEPEPKVALAQLSYPKNREVSGDALLIAVLRQLS